MVTYIGGTVPKTDEPSLFIHNAVIYPAMRRRGLGAAIVTHAKKLASKTGSTIIRLDTYGGRLGTFRSSTSLIND
jgi:GNAT superfamily N-acetyltransferase